MDNHSGLEKFADGLTFNYTGEQLITHLHARIEKHKVKAAKVKELAEEQIALFKKQNPDIPTQSTKSHPGILRHTKTIKEFEFLLGHIKADTTYRLNLVEVYKLEFVGGTLPFVGDFDLGDEE